MLLGELTVPVSRLKGVGPAALRDLDKLGITTLARLLEHLPRDYVNRRDELTFRQALAQGAAANTVARVVLHSHFGPAHRPVLKIHLQDREGTPAELPCFNRPFLERQWPVGAWVWVYGAPESKYGALQIASFELEPPPAGHVPGSPLGHAGALVPLYPLAGSLHHAGMARLVAQVWHDYVPEPLEDELPPAYAHKHGLIPLDKALRTLHRPESPETLEAARRTWVHRELFHLQTAILRRPTALRGVRRDARKLPTTLRDHFVERLPFDLTPDQKTVLDEIRADLESERPMARLLQGDVGSGKTLVAFLSALPLIEAGFQCALLAPTELLALQHAENAARVLEPLGVKLAFLSGNLKAAGRGKLLEELAAGRLDFVVGTHALFSDDVAFKNLRYVVIDEQHRFGVVQRQAMTRKGEDPDLLLMSATPIPRT
ncbi:MAG TPA: DEAD/DEAH box helicase, partial [Polyangiaceae bacterium]|nr:DEAD/DEAH box helicase [Polyangiaceae bacterium]